MNLILGLIVAAIVFAMADGLYGLMNRPEKTPIDRTERPGTALLVIDMQEDFTRSTGRFAHDPARRDAAIAAINEATATARAQGIPIIEVSHTFIGLFEKWTMTLFAGGMGTEGSQGLKRDRDLAFEANYHVLKHEGDSFTAPMLRRFLKDHAIGHLYLCGQDANACVKATAQGALARNYRVTLIDEGILARNPEKWAGARKALEAKGAEIGDLQGG